MVIPQHGGPSILLLFTLLLFPLLTLPPPLQNWVGNRLGVVKGMEKRRQRISRLRWKDIAVLKKGAKPSHREDLSQKRDKAFLAATAEEVGYILHMFVSPFCVYGFSFSSPF